MKELNVMEMEAIQGGGDPCRVAAGISAGLGTVALFAGVAALGVATGGTAWLALTATSLIAGVPSAGLGLGTAIGCS